jgi:hypothetical protein
MPWILAGGGVVVVAIAVVLIIVLTGGSDTSSPEGTAQAAVDAVNDKDSAALAELTCGASESDVEAMTDPGSVDESLAAVEINAELGEVTTEGDNKATAQVKVSYSNVPEQAKEFLKDSTIPLPLEKEGDKWCISGSGGAGSAPGADS